MQYYLGRISKNRVENNQQNFFFKFHLSNEENQCIKIQNIYLNLNLVLLWISSFKRLMKEQEFQECFCGFLPFSYTCSQYPDTTYCRLQIKSGMQTSEGSLMLTEQVFSCQIQVDFTLSQFVTPNQAKSKGTNSYSKEI